MRKFNAIAALAVGLLGFMMPRIYAITTSGAQPRSLNNFVTEYVNTAITRRPDKNYTQQPFKTYRIDHFRNGWIFISVRAKGGSGYVTMDSDSKKDAALTFPGNEKNSVETMRYISKGPHKIKVFTQGKPLIERLIIRSIPMTAVSELSFAVSELGKGSSPVNRVRHNDWNFYREFVNPNVNVICSSPDENREWEPYANEFRAKGRKWIFEKSYDWSLYKPGYTAAFEQFHYDDWSKALKEPYYVDGIMIDEWTSGAEWAEAFPVIARISDRIAEDPACRGKKIYEYGQAMLRDWYRPGVESIMRNGFVYLYEGYFFMREEQGAEQEQKSFIEGWAGNLIDSTWEARFPGIVANNLTYVVSTFNYHYSFDQTPAMDFKVFLDIVFNHLANSPKLRNLYGVSLYSTKGTTKDVLAFTSQLLRHYCIEGKKERFTNDPLKLTYLKNPGFEEGLSGWNIQQAGADSVKSVLVKDLPFEKKFTDQSPPTQDKVLVSVRSDKRPNMISQRLTGLKPGRYYSLTLYSADITDFHTRKLEPISIKLNGVQEAASEAEDTDITTFDYTDGKLGCVNYHFRVFKANDTEAELVLSDWTSASVPGGEPGHQIMWDHLKVEPYFLGRFLRR